MKFRLLVAGGIIAAAIPPAAAADAPWDRHGLLQVASGSRHLSHSDGTPFLWLGDTAWGMFQQLTREEVDHYLDQRQRLGFNVIQSVAYWYPHGGGMATGPENAANAYGHRPFVGGERTPDTARPLLADGGNADAPNDYWDHADYVVRAIRKRGMYLALLPTWGRASIVPQFGPDHVTFDEAKARSFGAFLGARYRDEPNIIWVLGGDAKAQIDGYDKNQSPVSFDKRSVFRAMAEGIGRGVTGKSVAWNKPDPAWDRLLMTYHPDGDAPDNSSKWFHNDAWLDMNGVEVWREMDLVYSTMLGDYQLNAPVKPSLFLEGSYEFGSYRYECGWVTPVKVRRQVYHSFFAGAAGHTYGAGPIWAMRGTGGDYNCGYNWKQALDFPGAAQFAKVAQPFLKKYGWTQWIPDGRFIDAVGEGDNLKVAVRSAGGDRAFVYFSEASSAGIRNRLGSSAVARWFDPRSGDEVDAGRFDRDQERLMQPPARWEDAVLVIEREPK